MGKVAALEAWRVCNRLEPGVREARVQPLRHVKVSRADRCSSLGPTDLCHPIPSAEPFTRDGWIFERKHDGLRALARKNQAGVQLLLRDERPISTKFPEIVDALATLPGDVVLDGELVVPDSGGRADFEASHRRALLQRPRAISIAANRAPAVLVVFDVLEIDDEDLRNRSLYERRDVLQWYGLPAPALRIIEHVETQGEALFNVVIQEQHEGIVAKRLDAPYRAGLQPAWRTIRNREYSRARRHRVPG